MKTAAVLLSGCGNMDGSEIHESVSAIIALDSAGWNMIFTAPDIRQGRTVSYVTGNAIEHRNAMEEAARIARGRILPLDPSILDSVDAVVVPGGLGAAVTLCDFADRGAECEADPEVMKFLELAHRRGKTIAAMCIAPALIARCLPGAEVTIGTDTKTAEAIRGMKCSHSDRGPEEVCVDRRNKVITTPAYMNASGPAQVFRGALRMVEALDMLTAEER